MASSNCKCINLCQVLDLVSQIQIESLSFPSGSPNLLDNVKESAYSGHCRHILAVWHFAVKCFWKFDAFFVVELVELNNFELHF